MTVATDYPGITAAFSLVTDQISALAPHEVVSVCSLFRSALAGVEAEALARQVDGTGSTRLARKILEADQSSSRREKFKRSQRAKAAATNPELATKVKIGELSEEQLDVLADASDKSDGNAAKDPDLIRKVSKTDPDQGREIAKKWLEDNADQDKVNTEYERQRKNRMARKGRNKDGIPSITLVGDQATIDAMFARAEKKADEFYQADGGRSIAHRDHPRTVSQRYFDAFHHLITHPGTAEPGSTTNDTGSNGPSTEDQARPPRTSGRPAVIVGCPLGKIDGTDPNALAIQFGSGPIPDTILQQYLTNCDLYFALTAPGTTNVPLALFRANRHASVNQFIALVFRDRGCVKCGAPPQKCQAHHLMPWNAPGKGETNLENLVLVCTGCHGELHNNKRTLFFDKDNDMWATRPATANEIAPPRPSASPKRSRGRPRAGSKQRAPA